MQTSESQDAAAEIVETLRATGDGRVRWFEEGGC